MNKFLKSALCVAGVAGAFSAAEAQAVSFTVVIDKIELVKDADNYPNTAVTVYDPAPGATSTVDLFDATQKLGTTFTLNKPPSGEYESAVIYFSNITAVSGSDSIDLLAAYKTAGTLATYGSEGVMVLGDDGTGSDATDLDQVFAASFAPMQSIIADGTNDITMPTMDFYLPEANLVSNGSTIGLSAYPEVTLSVSQYSDSASRANVLVDVDDLAFGAVTGWSLGASVVTVGLFDTSVPATPLVATTYTTASTAASNQVELIDVPEGTVYPIAWSDSDEDGRLDAGEYYTFAEAVRATNALPVSGTSDVSATDYIALAGTDGILDSTALAFPGRTVSITVELSNEVSANAVAGNCDTADGLDGETGIVIPAAGLTGIAATAGCGASTNSSITVVYAVNAANTISQSVELQTRLAAVTGDTNIDTTEAADPILLNTTQFASMDNVDYYGLATVALDNATSGRVIIMGVPVFDTDFDADLNGAAFDLEFRTNWLSDVATEVGATVIDETTSASAYAVGDSVGNTIVIDDSIPVSVATD